MTPSGYIACVRELMLHLTPRLVDSLTVKTIVQAMRTRDLEFIP
jgi:hypothetical protein